MNSAKCEENGPDKCLPAYMYDLDRKKCNECYPLGGMSKVCGENDDYMREPREVLGGKSPCELIIEAMGGEGIWDDAVHQQMMEQTHTWIESDYSSSGGYWEQKCLEPCNDYDGCCVRYDESWGDHLLGSAYEIYHGYVDEIWMCNSCENAGIKIPPQYEDHMRAWQTEDASAACHQPHHPGLVDDDW
ncbi:hypothetical protein TrCOL_g7928 [Triparma columacea]|uniref:Uncharacterized protein n=1 Tax=Triparma columacea TaxID=722753 RepID=A0A9W7GRU8_9STRA|nr:hypothetical protein TrCOL_g7928 [Triparma columacea]